MSNPGEIPGFYFDPDRKKYFRIQPTHRAPQGAAHSQGAVNAQSQARKRIDEAQIRESKRQNGCISRPKSTTFTRLSLQMRNGVRARHNLHSLSRHFAAALRCRSASPYEGHTIESITVSAKGNLYATTASQREGNYKILQLNAKQKAERDVVMFRPLLTQTQFVIINEMDFAMFMDSDFATGKLSFEAGPGGHGFRGYQTNITDIASPLDPSARNLAFTNEVGLFTISDVSHSSPEWVKNAKVEQKAVTFKDNNIIMSGTRDGIVYFTDQREPAAVARLKHSSAINGIVNARSTNHIIVSGLQSISLYDLRYTKAVAKPIRKGKKRIKVSNPPTQPLVPFHFPEERQSDFYGTGKPIVYLPSHDIAVVASYRSPLPSNSQNAPAAAQDIITLYDASKGQILSSPLISTTFTDPITGLATGRLRDGPESIFVSTRKRLYEWAVDIPDEEIETPRTAQQQNKVFVGGHGAFPPDFSPGIAELWRRGDRGVM